VNKQSVRNLLYEYLAMMTGVLSALPPHELAALTTWEYENVTGDGVYGTSDWPGWIKYIGPPPLPVKSTNNKKSVISHRLRWEVFLRDNFTCRKCSVRTDLSADHIIAESKGGKTVLDNLQTLCRSCNSKKGTK
jgi:hypothetical protein